MFKSKSTQYKNQLSQNKIILIYVMIFCLFFMTCFAFLYYNKQHNSHSVFTGEGIKAMHAKVVNVKDGVIIFVDDLGVEREMLQDNADAFYIGQVFHFNYLIDENEQIKVIDNSAGGH